MHSCPQTRFFCSLLILSTTFCFLPAVHGADSASPARDGEDVKCREEKIVIPTYLLGPSDPYPMFYTGESYQGAQKRIYPYPFQDNLTHVRSDVTYKAVFLENEYVKFSILPELGCRLFSAVDKTNGYDFFYRQHVIKPALIGMLGAWISGGIEWCAFHHHRNTTFMPVDYILKANPDGSKTMWFGETERRHRMKWLIGLTLFPGRSYIKATIRFFNRTALPHSILYWANVSVHVNDSYQVIFPPSVNLATYHSKNAFTHWPVSRGFYRGYNYRGVDISWWKNSPPPNSFFAWQIKEDFMGGYDHGKEAGVVHIGNHHIVCGAKLWEWGTGDRGKMWEKVLTDSDGPYAEIMVGAFSDNQPDYSWIKPYEAKEATQYWYPVRKIGGFKNANLDAAVNLELTKKNDEDTRTVSYGFHVTSKRPDARAILKKNGTILSEQTIDISPDKPFTAEAEVPGGTEITELEAVLVTKDGETLISYRPKKRPPDPPLPDTVTPPPPPEKIKTIEELYLTGLRIEQIHNPRIDPFKYYNEALKRDPADTRTNTIVGINYLKQGRYAQAEEHLRTVLKRLTAQYTRPKNGAAHFYLGSALRKQGRLDEAFDQFYRASWDASFHSAAHYQLAELSCIKGDFSKTLSLLENCLATNALNTKALSLKAAVLRKLGRHKKAEKITKAVLQHDPLDCTQRAMRDDVQSSLERASDYMHAGMWEEAASVVQLPLASKKCPESASYPLLHYMLGYCWKQLGNTDRAAACYRKAQSLPETYCFPFRLEMEMILEDALSVNSDDAKALYYLGNLFYEKQPEKAIKHWEASQAINPDNAVLHRNLGWAYHRFEQNIPKAIKAYEKALACDASVPRLFLELDRLYQLGNVAGEKRLALLETHHKVVAKHVESFIREIMVLVRCGKYDRAISSLSENFFHIREGGGEIHDIHVDAHLLKGIEELKKKNAAAALDHFQKADAYPENLSVGRPKNDRRAPQVAFLTALALEAAGRSEKATEYFEKASKQKQPAHRPHARFYEARALEKLGKRDDADRIYQQIIRAAEKRLTQQEETDFFAKFGEKRSKAAVQADAHFALGLGLRGQGKPEKAKEAFQKAVALDASHTWAHHYCTSETPAPAASEIQKFSPDKAPITHPPAALNTDPFYKKCLSVGGLPVLSSERVSDAALREAAYLIKHMVEHKPAILKAMVKAGVRIVVMHPNEMTTDIPEQRHMKPKKFWDLRARGLGGRITSCGAENLLNLPGDRYCTENILIHEFAHCMHGYGLRRIDRSFDKRLKAAYEKALDKGLWKGTYAATNRSEYWAEGVQSWFNTNRENDSLHNHVNTREEMKAYDPGLTALLKEVYGDGPWRYVRYDVRTREQAAKFRFLRFYADPEFSEKGAPGFVRAADLDGDGDLDLAAGGSGQLVVYQTGGRVAEWHRFGGLDGTHSLSAHSAALCDVDGDGDPDLVSASSKSGIGWWENPETLSATPWTLHKGIGTGGLFLRDLLQTDLDGDGKCNEFVAALTEPGSTAKTVTIKWFRIPAGKDAPDASWEVHTVEAKRRISARCFSGLAAGDIDRDGRVDIAFSNGWYRAPEDPSGAWSRHPVTDQEGISHTQLHDFDADGDLDIALAAGNGGRGLFLFSCPEKPAEGSWEKHTIDREITCPQGLVVIDMDGDGDADIVSCSLDPTCPEKEKHHVYVYENRGTASEPSWNRHDISSNSFPCLRVQVMDVDGDGKLDISGVSSATPIVSFYNNGSPEE